MNPRRQFAILCLALLSLWAVALPASAHEQPIVRIGVLALRGPAEALRRWDLTAAYLSSSIPGHVFRIVPLTFHEIHGAVTSEQVDFILCNPSMYVELEMSNGASAMLTITETYRDVPISHFGGVVVTRAFRDDIKTLSDLKDKTIAAVDPDSLGGWRALARELAVIGITPERHLKRIDFAGTHDAAVMAVLRGEVDAATVRTGTLERMSHEQKISLRDFRILPPLTPADPTFPLPVSTRLYPEWPLARLAHTPQDLAISVDAALLSLSAHHPAARAAGLSGWSPPQNYAPVHDLLDALHLGPYKTAQHVDPIAVIQQYWHIIGLTLLILGIFAAGGLHVLRLYAKLKRSQAALLESERKFRTMFECHPAVMVLADANTRTIIEANPAASNFYGYSPEELRGMSVTNLDTAPPEVLGEYMRDAVSSSRNVFHVQNRLASGEVRDVEVQAVPFHMGERNVLYSIINDVTDRVRAERELRDALSELQTILESSQVGIMYLRGYRFIAGGNAKLAEIFGYDSIDDMIGLSVFHVHTSEESFAQFGTLHYEKLVSGAQLQVEYQLRRKDGTPIWCTLSGAAVDRTTPPSLGRGVIWIIDDITDRKRMEQELHDAFAFQKLIIENRMVGICFVKHRQLQWANQRVFALSGYSQDELVGHSTRIIFPNDDVHEAFGQYAYTALGRGDMYDAIHQLIRPDGQLYWAHLMGTALDPAKPDEGSLWLFDDVTQRKELEDELLRTNRMQQVLLENGIMGIALVKHRRFQWVNSRMMEMTGLTEAEILNAPTRIIHMDDATYEAFGISAYEAIARGELYDTTLPLRRGDNQSFWCRFTGRALDPSHPNEGSVWMFEDITERRRMEEDLRRMATRDSLTGAYNRRRFMEKAEEELVRARRYSRPLAVLMIDLDHFKGINDSYGHHAGDDVLRAMVQACLDTIRETDVFGRMGGEEFAAVLTETPADAARDVAERIRSRLENTPVASGGKSIHFTASIGLTALSDTDNSLQDALRRADRNLYVAKQKGRNRVVWD
ncbi:diguanylate cyclase (GGDEF)-like protein/PAS domain S-box-containing protein [Desulfobaculum xiamenense]|uniref:Diguanylate cyclase (GGDEF)-like protein/PAS domain S-box-containing protein n=1 Tax=Desulfobaculum xiamenense TaxID=995050 RepID=A0A846QQ62_9BACT|nr:PAS domain S-box protein [Desulfobaculum xiamenense]NJB68642.1 diguanylate cyclase (GGDEF)-like protein/PAS domain S-box-containing protein [Desulfobaculum xiamenense]